MRIQCLALIAVVLLVGCSAEQRLGESQVQKRRYSKGYHVQHHRGPKAQQNGGASEASVHPEIQQGAVAPMGIGHDQPTAVWLPDEKAGMSNTPDQVEVTPVQLAAEREAAQVHQEPREKEPSSPMHGPVYAVSETLPDPVDGRHPSSVPGFILSLGWAIGIAGEGAVQYLGIPLAGVPIALGLVATVFGYFLSGKAFRKSLEHPELYPRFKLSRAARWVALALFAPVALYLALVVLILIVLGGW